MKIYRDRKQMKWLSKAGGVGNRTAVDIWHSFGVEGHVKLNCSDNCTTLYKY